MKKTLLAGIAALSVLGAPAAHAAPRVVVGKPRIIITTIRGSMFPPPKYDKPYEGELEIIFFSNSADVKAACPNTSTDTACATHSVDLKRCWIHMGTEEVIKREGGNYTFTLRHELAHCNGWKHPNTTNGRKFKAGEVWMRRRARSGLMRIPRCQCRSFQRQREYCQLPLRLFV